MSVKPGNNGGVAVCCDIPEQYQLQPYEKLLPQLLNQLKGEGLYHFKLFSHGAHVGGIVYTRTWLENVPGGFAWVSSVSMRESYRSQGYEIRMIFAGDLYICQKLGQIVRIVEISSELFWAGFIAAKAKAGSFLEGTTKDKLIYRCP